MAPQKWLHNFIQPPILGAQRGMTPTPTAPAHPPLINDRSLMFVSFNLVLFKFLINSWTQLFFKKKYFAINSWLNLS